MAASRVVFNSDELDALAGLPHLTQLIYFRAIRPEMDFKSGLVGLRSNRTKKISYQSISEAVFVEPATGRVKPEKEQKGKLRHAVGQLVNAGLLEVISPANPTSRQLIFKCLLADVGYSVQNKDSTPPTHQSEKAQHTSNTPSDEPEANSGNGFGDVDSESSVDKSAHLQHTNSEKDSTPLSTEYKHTDITRAGARGAGLIPESFCIDADVLFRLKAGGVKQDVAEFFLDEFKAANESSGFCSMNWAAEFVKYCHRWKWRFEKEKENAGNQQNNQSQNTSRASRVHQRNKQKYQDAVARELGEENLQPDASPLRSQVVIPYRGRRD